MFGYPWGKPMSSCSGQLKMVSFNSKWYYQLCVGLGCARTALTSLLLLFYIYKQTNSNIQHTNLNWLQINNQYLQRHVTRYYVFYCIRLNDIKTYKYHESQDQHYDICNYVNYVLADCTRLIARRNLLHIIPRELHNFAETTNFHSSRSCSFEAYSMQNKQSNISSL